MASLADPWPPPGLVFMSQSLVSRYLVNCGICPISPFSVNGICAALPTATNTLPPLARADNFEGVLGDVKGRWHCE